MFHAAKLSRPNTPIKFQNCVRKSRCLKMNVLVKIVSKSKNLSNPESLKTTYKNLSNNSTLSKTEAFSINERLFHCQTCTVLSQRFLQLATTYIGLI